MRRKQAALKEDKTRGGVYTGRMDEAGYGFGSAFCGALALCVGKRILVAVMEDAH